MEGSEAQSESLLMGEGAPLLLIHGSATDRSTWTVQLHGLKREFQMLAYNRCIFDEQGEARSVEAQARDLARLIASELPSCHLGTCHLVGSSFGAVVALELARRSASLVRSLVLCEPPLASSDYLAAVPDGFACRFDSAVNREGGLKAGEFFLRSVLGNDAFEKMPRTFAARSVAMWKEIRGDMFALSRYQVRYQDLHRELTMPVALLGGERSAPFYRETLEALELAIPHAQLEILRSAGHMMHVDAAKQFAAVLRRHTGINSN